MVSTYKKNPSIELNGFAATGWDDIISIIEKQKANKRIVVIDCYTGVHYTELKSQFTKLKSDLIIDTKDLFISESKVEALTKRFMTDDVLFGYMSNISLPEYFDKEKLEAARKHISETKGCITIFGHGAQLVANGDILIYADMPRWEIQQRMRRREAKGLGIDNSKEPFSFQYKRGMFNDWRVLDKHKRNIYQYVDYWLDTVITNDPKMIDRQTFYAGMDKAATSPFRVVPFFDPAPWGGQWMKEVCNLDPSKSNYGWCFDCVPEENSLLLEVGGIVFEMPSVNLVYTKSRELLGEPVESRFGKEFPIRFDFLDTVKGGNLSLQVHPTTQYVHDNFGLNYTQDESYYIMDAKEGATVYLGLKTGIDNKAMIEDLEKAEKGDFVFDAEKYVNKFPTKKHDHFLIPSGTIHCSGIDAVVLEISSTPNLFTFKLWDWQRLGLDGKPRPINVQRGKEVIDWGRDTKYTETIPFSDKTVHYHPNKKTIIMKTFLGTSKAISLGAYAYALYTLDN
ncbi:class I mannose-6-phosphate isomerase [Dysgonomonas sp. 511]|uniref:class I mannose-6-phosphate isomerase n=1 Tax=Dysgonomonas sp. 511 TaxID=2302930 RepID=UPI0013D3477E|nr:class I mannose-6-phosphate isomerase [Dysgonomonas sp. 511]NDV78680.1 mannose-6-phosphate isomerase [Dysgonomonas sp. 511]